MKYNKAEGLPPENGFAIITRPAFQVVTFCWMSDSGACTQTLLMAHTNIANSTHKQTSNIDTTKRSSILLEAEIHEMVSVWKKWMIFSLNTSRLLAAVAEEILLILGAHVERKDGVGTCRVLFLQMGPPVSHFQL